MLSSNTLIALPAASKLGLGKSRASMTSISGTIITDTLVLVILAFLTALLSDGESEWFLLLLLGKLIMFASIVFLYFPIHQLMGLKKNYQRRKFTVYLHTKHSVR